MTITWELGISSATAISLIPKFSYRRSKRQIRRMERSRNTGELFIYKHGDFTKYRVPVTFLSNFDSGIVNSWWDTNTQLLFFITSGGVTEVNSVMIMGSESPLQQMQKPFSEFFKGTIRLEGY